MSALAEFQSAFMTALMRPDADRLLSLGKGLHVHQNTVLTGLMDVLRANYPTIEQLVGAEWFAEAARHYVRLHWPVEPALALYGESFAAFLQTCPGARSLPYLTPVAHLDRLWTETHFADDAPVLPPALLAKLPTRQLAALQLRLHPAARLAWLPHSAVTIWMANRPPATLSGALEVDDADEGVLLARPHGAVQVLKLDQAEHALLNAVQQGASLSKAAMQALQLHAGAPVDKMLAHFLHAGAFHGDDNLFAHDDAQYQSFHSFEDSP